MSDDDPKRAAVLRQCESFVALENALDVLAKEHNAVCEKPSIRRQVLIQYANCEVMEWVGEPRWWDVDPNTMLCVRCGKAVKP